MLTEIKKQLLQKPEYIQTILQHYNFSNIQMRQDEIRCGYDDEHNPTSIRIKLVNNDNLFVKDFGRNQSYDLFTYIIKNRNTTYHNIISYVQQLLHIVFDADSFESTSVFGGFYDKIKLHRNNIEIYKTYPENILNQYSNYPNIMFLKDNISIEAQKYFNIHYDVQSQRIIIPIYDSCGNLIGVKGRANWEVTEDDIKYLYLVPCRVSSTLYGYSHNYSYLTNDTVYIVESEKAVMQAYSYGMRNFVSLLGNELHDYQCKLLMELAPKKIIFLLDEGLDIDITQRNIKKLLTYTHMFDIEIGYWNYKLTKDIPSKSSPCDLGKEKLTDILDNDIVYI